MLVSLPTGERSFQMSIDVISSYSQLTQPKTLTSFPSNVDLHSTRTLPIMLVIPLSKKINLEAVPFKRAASVPSSRI